MSKKLERILDRPYEYDYIKPDGGRLRFKWNAPQVGKDGRVVRSISEVPDEVFDDMLYNSVTLSHKKLVLVEESMEEDKNMVNDYVTDEFKDNTYTIEEVSKILKKQVKDIKVELKDKSPDTVKFFVRVYKKLGMDSAKKEDLFAELLGVPRDFLFEN